MTAKISSYSTAEPVAPTQGFERQQRCNRQIAGRGFGRERFSVADRRYSDPDGLRPFSAKNRRGRGQGTGRQRGESRLGETSRQFRYLPGQCRSGRRQNAAIRARAEVNPWTGCTPPSRGCTGSRDRGRARPGGYIGGGTRALTGDSPQAVEQKAAEKMQNSRTPSRSSKRNAAACAPTPNAPRAGGGNGRRTLARPDGADGGLPNGERRQRPHHPHPAAPGPPAHRHRPRRTRDHLRPARKDLRQSAARAGAGLIHAGSQPPRR